MLVCLSQFGNEERFFIWILIKINKIRHLYKLHKPFSQLTSVVSTRKKILLSRKLWIESSPNPNAASSFELDVVLCSLSILPLQHRSCSVCMSLSGWATTTGRMLGPKVGNSIKCLSQGHSDALPHRESNQGFAIFWLLAWKEAEPWFKATFTDLRKLLRNFLSFSLACLFYFTFGSKSFVHW